jgi:hypothetical protein
MYICNNLPIHHKKGVETISKWVVYDIVLPTWLNQILKET